MCYIQRGGGCKQQSRVENNDEAFETWSLSVLCWRSEIPISNTLHLSCAWPPFMTMWRRQILTWVASMQGLWSSRWCLELHIYIRSILVSDFPWWLLHLSWHSFLSDELFALNECTQHLHCHRQHFSETVEGSLHMGHAYTG